jgi:Ni/Co efflux regulator RcnB
MLFFKVSEMNSEPKENIMRRMLASFAGLALFASPLAAFAQAPAAKPSSTEKTEKTTTTKSTTTKKHHGKKKSAGRRHHHRSTMGGKTKATTPSTMTPKTTTP